MTLTAQELAGADTEVVKAVAARATATLVLAVGAAEREAALEEQVAALNELVRRQQR